MNNLLSIKRNLRKYTKKISDKIHFTVSHLSLGGKLALFALGVCFLSLFFPWFSVPTPTSASGYFSLNPFSSLLGYIGYLYICIIFIAFFYILSIKNKAKLRYVSGMNVNASYVIILAASFSIISGIHLYLVIQGMRFFSSEIFHERGLVLFLTGSIILAISGNFLKKEEIKNISGSYSYTPKNRDIPGEKTTKEENMKLPI